MPNPFKRELIEYDSFTGELKETSQTEEPMEMTKVEKMRKARIENLIRKANEMYRDAVLIKIDYNNPDSAYIMMVQDKNHNTRYNTCRSEDDKRPILKVWMDNNKKKDDNQCLGKIDWRNATVKYHKVNPDGTIQKAVAMVLDESMNTFNN